MPVRERGGRELLRGVRHVAGPGVHRMRSVTVANGEVLPRVRAPDEAICCAGSGSAISTPLSPGGPARHHAPHAPCFFNSSVGAWLGVTTVSLLTETPHGPVAGSWKTYTVGVSACPPNRVHLAGASTGLDCPGPRKDSKAVTEHIAGLRAILQPAPETDRNCNLVSDRRQGATDDER
jgi:hypothetical protein